MYALMKIMNSVVWKDKIALAILAGGAGSRLGGRDKGLELLRGKPLVTWVIAALRPQVNSIVICANRNLAEYAKYGETITDLKSGFAGPLMGIASALALRSNEWLLTTPVDCPLPPNDLSKRLYQMAITHKAAITVVHDGRRRQPLFALYRRELAKSDMQAINNNLSVWQWQDRCDALEVDFSDKAASFTNLNTEQEFDLFEKEINGYDSR